MRVSLWRSCRRGERSGSELFHALTAGSFSRVSELEREVGVQRARLAQDHLLLQRSEVRGGQLVVSTHCGMHLFFCTFVRPCAIVSAIHLFLPAHLPACLPASHLSAHLPACLPVLHVLYYYSLQTARQSISH